MPLNTAGLQVGGVAIAAVLGQVSLHTAEPDASGSNLSTAGKVDASFTSTGGDIAMDAAAAFTGGEASGPVWGAGYWSADGTTFYGAKALPTDGSVDVAFNAAGEYTLDTLVIDGS